MWIQIELDQFEKGGADYIRARIEHYRDIDDGDSRRYRDAAKVRDGELEVDEDAVVSVSDDDGAYVMSWQWVSDEDAGIEREEEEEYEEEEAL